ncbi:uncharacterized protein SEPMUDRAFT_65080 [Sphaerulina musiva SO2202]|uniref:Metallo-beta-lactamase domain-containing protein n=1 Tax=Sphaerulina musiva (strain SO2202) TaxID=692275 RepID=M3D6L0_SPHMS|nr:uncharacterized protein SEPMUDRAFT_65080 [Sphaerulina musiva SO2202]EMF13805.1 hypothetical protein SEPMUDRAFT_65080 [Sphaerulina musiva SO2202]
MPPLQTSEDLLICCACGTQFDISANQPLQACRICDDPRQFVPPTGQSWTSLHEMHTQTQPSYHNTFHPDALDSRITSICTSPKFAIGQRCILLETSHGNILWDCITYLDQATVDFIASRGGLRGIVISHPHYYTTHLDWARTFDCPVWFSQEDAEEWVSRGDGEGRRRLILKGRGEEDVLGVVKAIKVGGHFPGSLVLLWEKKLFVADSLVTTPSALYHHNRPPGTNSYVFMWSIPNMIPLAPSEIYKIWLALRKHEFESTYGAFVGTEVRDTNVKVRVLESMKIQVRAEGWGEEEEDDNRKKGVEILGEVV